MCVCVCVCVCSLGYTACNAHAPYYHLWPAPLRSIFPHYLINGTTLGIKLLNTMCVFWFSVQLLSETFLIVRSNERDIIKNAYWSSTRSPFVSLLSRRPQSGRWSSSGKRVWFTESHIILIISFYNYCFIYSIYCLYKTTERYIQ